MRVVMVKLPCDLLTCGEIEKHRSIHYVDLIGLGGGGGAGQRKDEGSR